MVQAAQGAPREGQVRLAIARAGQATLLGQSLEPREEIGECDRVAPLTLECRICLLNILPDQSIVRSNLVSMKNLLANEKLTD